jgi:hypothetical protein
MPKSRSRSRSKGAKPKSKSPPKPKSKSPPKPKSKSPKRRIYPSWVIRKGKTPKEFGRRPSAVRAAIRKASRSPIFINRVKNIVRHFVLQGRLRRDKRLGPADLVRKPASRKVVSRRRRSVGLRPDNVKRLQAMNQAREDAKKAAKEAAQAAADAQAAGVAVGAALRRSGPVTRSRRRT